MNFGLKKVYFFALRQEAEIDADAEILQRVVDEAGVARLVAAHEAEELAACPGSCARFFISA